MNITPINHQRNQNQTAFGARLEIKYINNIGNKFHDGIDLGNTLVKTLKDDEVAILEKLAAATGKDIDRIKFKINANTDVYKVGEGNDMGSRFPILDEQQKIIAITDISNNLDSIDLSRENNIFNNGLQISKTSPFEILENYLKTLLGTNK